MVQVKRDIRWFINDSQTALGLHSAYSAFENAMNSPGHVLFVCPEYTDATLKQISRHRKIYKAVMQLPHDQYRYLQAMYCDEYQPKYPLIIKGIFKEKTGLLFCLHNDMHELLKLCENYRHKSMTPNQEARLKGLIMHTDKVYEKLHHHLKELLHDK